MPKSFNSIYLSERSYEPLLPYNKKREYLSSVQVDFNGRPVPQSQYVVDDPSTRYNGLKASDFALENQIAVGVDFKPVKCSLNVNEIDSMIEKANNNNYE